MTVLKSIVVCLALANAAYFLWAHGIAASKEAPIAVAPPAATLKLVGEAPSASNEAVGSSSGTVVTAAGNDAPNPGLLTNVKRCVTVGPFRDVAEASHAASLLRGGGYDPRQRVVDGDVWAGVCRFRPVPWPESNCSPN